MISWIRRRHAAYTVFFNSNDLITREFNCFQQWMAILTLVECACSKVPWTLRTWHHCLLRAFTIKRNAAWDYQVILRLHLKQIVQWSGSSCQSMPEFILRRMSSINNENQLTSSFIWDWRIMWRCLNPISTRKCAAELCICIVCILNLCLSWQICLPLRLEEWLSICWLARNSCPATGPSASVFLV